jgi:hypothetical protein
MCKHHILSAIKAFFCGKCKEKFELPKSEIEVPMPPCKPPKNQVEELAYLLAEQDGFRGEALSYWVEAEKRLNAPER